MEVEKNQEYYSLYYKERKEVLSSDEKKRMNELSYQKAMEFRKHNPKQYGLLLIGIAYEEIRSYYTKSKNRDCAQLLYLIDRLKIRMAEVCSIYSLSKDEVRNYFERNRYETRFCLSDF